jgi:pimeloyl-ACP methyl ester carboxylesterase
VCCSYVHAVVQGARHVRGDAEHGAPEAYLNGLRTAGMTCLEGAVIEHCGHFSPDEQPQALAQLLRDFLGR